MIRRSYYRKKSNKLILPIMVLLGLILVGGYNLFKSVDLSDIVANSELEVKNFDARVQEILSPKFKIGAYLLEDRNNPIISISFIFKSAGYASDNEGEEGIANMVAALLKDGTNDLDAQAFKEELENLAIGLDFSVDKDDFSGSLLTTRDNAAKAFELLKKVLSNPRFEAIDVARVKQELFEALRRQSEQPENVLSLVLAEDIYGKHPYGRNSLGKADDIAKVDEEKLRTFIKDNFSRQNLIVGIAGDISKVEAENFLDEVFGVLPANGKINFVPEAKLDFDGREKQITRKGGQNIVVMAWQGVSRKDKDFYPLFVANHILGGSGLTSRLSQKIREEKGLTYGVYSYLSLDDKSPLLVASFASTPEKYTQARDILAQQWQIFKDNGVSAQELKKAKDYLVASYNLRFASIGNIAEILAAMQKYDLGLDFLQKRNDYVREVTLDQVNEAAKKYFDYEKQISAAIGDF